MLEIDSDLICTNDRPLVEWYAHAKSTTRIDSDMSGSVTRKPRNPVSIREGDENERESIYIPTRWSIVYADRSNQCCSRFGFPLNIRCSPFERPAAI